MAPASAAVLGGEIDAGTLPPGATWSSAGTDETVTLCLTVPVPSTLEREAVLRAAMKARAKLVSENCEPVAGNEAISASVVGLALQVHRAQVLVKPYGTPVVVTGAAKLEVPRTLASSVSVSNAGADDLALEAVTVTAPFIATHNCPLMLSALESCLIEVTMGDTSQKLAIGRLQISGGQGAHLLVPLRSHLDSSAAVLSTSMRN